MSHPAPDKVHAAVHARRDEIVQMLLDLVGISSVTGHEGDVQRYVSRALTGFGLEVDEFLSNQVELAEHVIHVGEQESFDDRPSIVATRSGTGGGKSLMLAGHVDTVPVEDRAKWSHSPEGELDGNRLYGLGSSDMKGGVIAAMMVPRILDDLGVRLHGDLLVNTVPGEEDGGFGTLSTILHGYRADGVIITEPTDNKVVIANGGSLVFRLTITGKAAHGGNRNAGVSAIEKFVPIFQDLLAWEAERQQTIFHPLYDHLENKFPISVGVVRSGDWASTVPDKLVAEGRLGFIPGELMEDMMGQFEARVAAIADADDWMRDHPPVIEYFGGQFTAEEIPADHPLTQAMLAAHKAVIGNDTEVIGFTAGADNRHWVHFTDCPALLYSGGVFRMAHQSDEYIEIDALLESIAVLTQATMDWCGVA
jgi:acetylornithine deacetylase